MTDGTKEALRHASSIVEAWQSLRATSGSPPESWLIVSRVRSSKVQHHSPRWTFRFLYFRDPIAKHFAGATGLDVGARVSRSEASVSHPRLAVPRDRYPEDFSECFIAHHAYYVDIGCAMEAIDINATADDDPIKLGDARVLSFPAESFDFITAPMLLGPERFCASPIEIALCVSEFYRVLRPGGFFYLADPTVEPAVVYAAQLAGFECYCAKGECGLPVGTLCRRGGHCTTTNSFRPIFEGIHHSSLVLSDGGDETIWSADLIWDAEAPSVEATR